MNILWTLLKVIKFGNNKLTGKNFSGVLFSFSYIDIFIIKSTNNINYYNIYVYYLIDELFKKHKQRSFQNGQSEDEDLYSMDHDLTVFVLELIANTMIHWNIHRDEITQFVINMCTQAKLPEDHASKMIGKMNNDSFWVLDSSIHDKKKKKKVKLPKKKK